MRKLSRKEKREVVDRLIVGTLLMMISYAACLALVFIIEDMMATQLILETHGEKIAVALGMVYIAAITVITLLGLWVYITCLIKVFRLQDKKNKRRT